MATKKLVTATAKEKGFFGGSIRYPGETFAVPVGAKASWFDTQEAVTTTTTATDPTATDPAASDLV